MKILYFSNSPLTGSSYNGGGWIFSLIKEAINTPGIECAVAFFDDHDEDGTFQSVPYYRMKSPEKKDLLHKAYFNLKKLFGNHINLEKKQWKKYESILHRIIQQYNPDIIHIFGSEMHFGLVANQTEIPVVLHIQGVLNPYNNAMFPPLFNYNNTHSRWNLLGSVHSIMTKKRWEANCYREIEVFNRVNFFIGRTKWDKRITYCLNPQALYFYGSEILRSEFYEENQRCFQNKHEIVSTTSDPMYKGFDMILKSAYILKFLLKQEFKWRVFGNINPEIIERVVGIRHEDVNIYLEGVASGRDIRDTLLNSSCYMHPSYIDNSPNSVCEAQILGVPVIGCNVGGLDSLIEDGKTGFLVPANDPYQAAYCLNKLLEDENLNINMGRNSRLTALERHNKERIIERLYKTYRFIIDNK